MKKSGVKNAAQNCKNGVKIGTDLNDIFAQSVRTQKQENDQR